MPPKISKTELVQKYGTKHRCPKCGAVHHWQSLRCRRPGCGFVGKMPLASSEKLGSSSGEMIHGET